MIGRDLIFYKTHVTYQGKLCNLIIEGEGTENVVPGDLIEKLNLKMEHIEHQQLLGSMNMNALS